MYSQLETVIEKIVTGFISGECIFNSTLFYKKIVIGFISGECILNFHFCRKLQKKKKKTAKKKKTLCKHVYVQAWRFFFFIFAEGV